MTRANPQEARLISAAERHLHLATQIGADSDYHLRQALQLLEGARPDREGSA